MGVVLPQPIPFGKYTLFERIGRGGMADVFKARIQGPAGFERVFVVKRILPHLCDDPQFTKMFIEEAKLSARLNHPNIVQVFELGNVDGEYFIAMEYVKGRDLADTMRTLWARIGPPRPELVAYIGREMCRALAYAHDLTGEDGAPLGMIHRDVSPSNVMLSYEGAVKILDFGIAKALGGDQQEEESGTQRGTLKGKFAYMAPEQTQGSDVDRRIDIFAAGIVLHEILTGRRLFKGENDLQTVEKVRQCEVPPPSLQNPLCPPELDAVVLHALSRDRDERFQSASEMADALDDLVHAARFQPTHLAQLMRDLFPAEAGPGPATGSARPSQTISGSVSRPHSVAMRSPTTWPPVSVARSSASQMQVPVPQEPTPPPPPPFYKRGVFWVVGVTMVGAAFAGGAFFTQQQAPVPVAGGASGVAAKPTGKIPIMVETIPPGADIFELGSDKKLGVTPQIVEFDFKSGEKRTIVLRKAGYEDLTKDLRPHVNVFSQLRPLPAKRGGMHIEPRSPSAPPPPSGSAPSTPSPSSKGSANEPPPPAPSPSGSRSGRDRSSRSRDRGASPSEAAAAPAPAAGEATGKKRSGSGNGEVIDPFGN